MPSKAIWRANELPGSSAVSAKESAGKRGRVLFFASPYAETSLHLTYREPHPVDPTYVPYTNRRLFFLAPVIEIEITIDPPQHQQNSTCDKGWGFCMRLHSKKHAGACFLQLPKHGGAYAPNDTRLFREPHPPRCGRQPIDTTSGKIRARRTMMSRP